MAALRRQRLPAIVRDRLALARGEHVLAWASIDPADLGSYAVATDLGLRLPPEYRLVRWEDIDTALWRPPELHVLGDDGVRRGVRMLDGEHLADTVRVRTENSIILTRHRRLRTDGRGVRVVARRRSDTGEVVWALRFDQGLDPADPALRRPAQAFLAEVRSELGP